MKIVSFGNFFLLNSLFPRSNGMQHIIVIDVILVARQPVLRETVMGIYYAELLKRFFQIVKEKRQTELHQDACFCLEIAPVYTWTIAMAAIWK